MRKLIFGLLFVVLISVIAVVCGIVFFLPPKLKSLAETSIADAVQGQAQIEDLQIQWGLPIKFLIRQITVQGKQPPFQAQLPEVIASVDVLSSLTQLTNPSLDSQIEATGAQITYWLAELANSPATPSAPTTATSALPTSLRELSAGLPLSDLKARLHLQNASFQLMQTKKQIQNPDRPTANQVQSNQGQPTHDRLLTLTKTNLQLQLASLDGPVDFDLATVIEPPTPYEKLILPVHLQAGLQLQNSQLKIQKSSLSVLGISAALTGAMDLKNQSQGWSVRVQSDDLTKIPAPNASSSLPISQWAGALQLGLDVKKDSSTAPFEAAGDLKLEKFRGQVQYASAPVHAQGAVALDLNARFRYRDKLTLPHLQWALDLTGMSVTVKDLFAKDPAIPLEIKGQATYEEVLSLQDFSARLAGLRLELKGQVSPKGPSDLQFDLPTANLSGLEKMILPVKQFPLSGEVAARGRVQGVLTDTKSLQIALHPFKLKQVQGSVQWQSADKGTSLSGPFLINAEIDAQIANLQPQTANAVVQADLTGFEVAYKDLFKKTRGQTLKIDAKATTKGLSVMLERGEFATHFGELSLRGRLPSSASSPMDLQLGLNRVDFLKLGQWVPMVARFVKEGALKSQLRINGSLNIDDVMKSPMAVTGTAQVALTQYEYRSAPAAKPTAEPAKPAPYDPSPFVTPSPLINGLQLTVDAIVQKFAFNDLAIEGIRTQSILRKGTLTSTGTISKVFDGGIAWKDVVVPLTQSTPTIRGQATLQQIEIQQGLAWALPQWKNLAEGKVAGDFQFETVLPAHPQFLQILKAKGLFVLREGVMRTLQFQQMLAEQLAKIPGVGEKFTPRNDVVKTQVKMNFDMQKGVMKLAPLDVGASPQNQLLVSGTLGVDAQVDLQGNAFLADPPVKGSFRDANADAAGRLQIPIMLKGNLLSPQLSFASESIKIMMGKALELEKNKALAELKRAAAEKADQVRKAAEAQAKLAAERQQKALADEVEKKKRALADDAKNQLNRLLGK